MRSDAALRGNARGELRTIDRFELRNERTAGAFLSEQLARCCSHPVHCARALGYYDRFQDLGACLAWLRVGTRPRWRRAAPPAHWGGLSR